MDTPERRPPVEVRLVPTWFLVVVAVGWLALALGAYQYLDALAAMALRTP